jgi:hypothetical protein
MADKNLKNTVKHLAEPDLNAHENQQEQQQRNDRRKEMIGNDDGYKENQNSYQ